MQAQILIADISGYTRFMSLHRVSLAHAQAQISRLLEAVIDAATPRRWKLSKLEGDAALFYRPDPERPVAEDALALRNAFLSTRGMLAEDRTCICGGCTQVADLTLKFVAHQGEVILQKVKGSRELFGLDVIVAHRFLKNSVPSREYLLLTGALHERLPGEVKERASSLTEHLEGIGETKAWWVDLSGHPVPPPPPPSFLRKMLGAVPLQTRGLPYLLGLKTASERVRHAAEPA